MSKYIDMQQVSSLNDDRNLSVFRPIRLGKAADAVVAVIVDAIRAGFFCPGDLLPTERSLSAQLQISRAVVREAVDRLRQEGVVSVKRGANGGIRVISDSRLREVIASLRGGVHDLMRAVLEARRSLEPPGFLLAASRASDEEVDALQPLVEGLLEVASDREKIHALDLKFHLEVVRLCGNPLVTEFYGSTMHRLVEIRQDFPDLRVPAAQAIHNQRRLYTALKTRQPDKIEAALDEHLTATEVVYLGESIKSTICSGWRHRPASGSPPFWLTGKSLGEN